MRLPRKLVALLTAAVLLLAGCWDRKEIEDVGFVVALGLDKGESKQVAITVQVAIPRNISVAAGAGGGGGGGGGDRPVVLVQRSEGDTVSEALREMEQSINRRLSFVHANVVLFGRELAEADITPHLGLLTRFRQFRRGAMVLMADGTAEEILSKRPIMEANPATFLEDLTRRAWERTARAPRIDLHRFLMGVESYAQESVMPIVHPITAGPGLNAKTLEKEYLSGTAIFQNGRLVGELGPDETEMFLILKREARAFLETIPLPGVEGKKVAVELTIERANIDMQITGGRPSFRITVITEGDLRESQAPAPGMVTPEGLQDLEARLSRQLTGRAAALIKKLQKEYRTDIIGLGNLVRMRFLEWPDWVAYDWPARFPDVPVQVSVKAIIRRVGMTFQPITPR